MSLNLRATCNASASSRRRDFVLPHTNALKASCSLSCEPMGLKSRLASRPGISLTTKPSLVAKAQKSDIFVPADPKETEGNKLWANIRAFSFFLWSFILSIPLFIIMLLQAPFVLNFDRNRRLAQHFMNNIWACVSTSIFYPVIIEGRENLPPPEKPVVYVANHQSFLDIYSLFHLGRPFKFISKTSNFLMPVIGWSMFLTGHVMINRVDSRSQMKCLKQCKDLLTAGAPVLFFPEGTRRKDCRLSGFKKGAFSVACKAGVDVIPVTLIGTGALMPSGRESELRSGAIRIVVHKAIPAGRDPAKVCREAREAIASALPPHLVGADEQTADD